MINNARMQIDNVFITYMRKWFSQIQELNSNEEREMLKGLAKTK